MYWAPYVVLSGIGGGLLCWSNLRRNLASIDVFARAPIRPDGSVMAWDDSRVGVTRIEIPKHVFWFTPKHRFAENGDDFWIVIGRFGFTMKGAAGTKAGEGRALFTKRQADSAKNRIIEYYSGPEDKKVFPFNRPKCQFLGVIFEEGWIRIKN